MTDNRAFLRHTLATIAYRGAKAIRNAGPSFADYSCGETSRTPVRILAHIGDLMDWALTMSEGRREWKDSLPLPWEKECERFFAAVEKLDDYLASEKPLQVTTEKFVSGPDRRRPHPRRADRDAAADGRRPDEERKLFRGRNHRRTRWRGSGGAAQGI
jgi:hypothetical protein